MNYIKSLKKIVSLVTLLTFIFTNTGYPSPLRPKDTLRVPLSSKKRLEEAIDRTSRGTAGQEPAGKAAQGAIFHEVPAPVSLQETIAWLEGQRLDFRCYSDFCKIKVRCLTPYDFNNYFSQTYEYNTKRTVIAEHFMSDPGTVVLTTSTDTTDPVTLLRALFSLEGYIDAGLARRTWSEQTVQKKIAEIRLHETIAWLEGQRLGFRFYKDFCKIKVHRLSPQDFNNFLQRREYSSDREIVTEHLMTEPDAVVLTTSTEMTDSIKLLLALFFAEGYIGSVLEVDQSKRLIQDKIAELRQKDGIVDQAAAGKTIFNTSTDYASTGTFGQESRNELFGLGTKEVGFLGLREALIAPDLDAGLLNRPDATYYLWDGKELKYFIAKGKSIKRIMDIDKDGKTISKYFDSNGKELESDPDLEKITPENKDADLIKGFLNINKIDYPCYIFAYIPGELLNGIETSPLLKEGDNSFRINDEVTHLTRLANMPVMPLGLIKSNPYIAKAKIAHERAAFEAKMAGKGGYEQHRAGLEAELSSLDNSSKALILQYGLRLMEHNTTYKKIIKEIEQAKQHAKKELAKKQEVDDIGPIPVPRSTFGIPYGGNDYSDAGPRKRLRQGTKVGKPRDTKAAAGQNAVLLAKNQLQAGVDVILHDPDIQLLWPTVAWGDKNHKAHIYIREPINETTVWVFTIFNNGTVENPLIKVGAADLTTNKIYGDTEEETTKNPSEVHLIVKNFLKKQKEKQEFEELLKVARQRLAQAKQEPFSVAGGQSQTAKPLIVEDIYRLGQDVKIEIPDYLLKQMGFSRIPLLEELGEIVKNSPGFLQYTFDGTTLIVSASGKMSGKEAQPEIPSRRKFLKTAGAAAVAAVLGLKPYNARSEVLTNEEKQEIVQQAMVTLQDKINKARATGQTLELAKLKEDGAFAQLEKVIDIFGEKEGLERILKFIIEKSQRAQTDKEIGGDHDVTYAMLTVLSWIDYYHPELKKSVKDAFSGLAEAETSIGEKAKELKRFFEAPPTIKVITLPKPLVILGEYAQKIVKWFVRITNMSPNKFTRAIIVPNNDPAVIAQAINDSMRMILLEGIHLYDQGLSLMVHALQGNFDVIDSVSDRLYYGSAGELQNIWAVYGGPASTTEPFVFDQKNPGLIQRSIGNRGWPFSTISEKWTIRLPNNRVVYWDQWRPIAGEAAWIAKGLLQALFIRYKGDQNLIKQHKGFKVAEEIARTTMIMQNATKRDTGLAGIAMGPIGTYKDGVDNPNQHPREFKWFYNEKSTENNLSWYSTFRMLHQITGDTKYQDELSKIEEYFDWAFDPSTKTFYQGGHYDETNHKWVKNTQFATDVQFWAILVLGVDWIDRRYGTGTAYEMLKRTVEQAGVKDANGKLIGFDYSNGKNRRGSEWSIFGDIALRKSATEYKPSNPAYRNQLMQWAGESQKGTQDLKKETIDEVSWRYSDVPLSFIPFGWYTPPGKDTEHTAANAWDRLRSIGEQDNQVFNPFILGGNVGAIDITTVERIKEERVSEIAELHQNYPNRFGNSGTNIKYTLKEEVSNVRIDIFGVDGKLVRSFNDLKIDKGTYIIRWNGLNNNGSTIGDGAYFINLVVTDKSGRIFRHVVKAMYMKGAGILKGLGVVGGGIIEGGIGKTEYSIPDIISKITNPSEEEMSLEERRAALNRIVEDLQNRSDFAGLEELEKALIKTGRRLLNNNEPTKLELGILALVGRAVVVVKTAKEKAATSEAAVQGAVDKQVLTTELIDSLIKQRWNGKIVLASDAEISSLEELRKYVPWGVKVAFSEDGGTLTVDDSSGKMGGEKAEESPSLQERAMRIIRSEDLIKKRRLSKLLVTAGLISKASNTPGIDNAAMNSLLVPLRKPDNEFVDNVLSYDLKGILLGKSPYQDFWGHANREQFEEVVNIAFRDNPERKEPYLALIEELFSGVAMKGIGPTMQHGGIDIEAVLPWFLENCKKGDLIIQGDGSYFIKINSVRGEGGYLKDENDLNKEVFEIILSAITLRKGTTDWTLTIPRGSSEEQIINLLIEATTLTIEHRLQAAPINPTIGIGNNIKLIGQSI